MRTYSAHFEVSNERVARLEEQNKALIKRLETLITYADELKAESIGEPLPPRIQQYIEAIYNETQKAQGDL